LFKSSQAPTWLSLLATYSEARKREKGRPRATSSLASGKEEKEGVGRAARPLFFPAGRQGLRWEEAPSPRRASKKPFGHLFVRSLPFPRSSSGREGGKTKARVGRLSRRLQAKGEEGGTRPRRALHARKFPGDVPAKGEGRGERARTRHPIASFRLWQPKKEKREGRNGRPPVVPRLLHRSYKKRGGRKKESRRPGGSRSPGGVFPPSKSSSAPAREEKEPAAPPSTCRASAPSPGGKEFPGGRPLFFRCDAAPKEKGGGEGKKARKRPRTPRGGAEHVEGSDPAPAQEREEKEARRDPRAPSPAASAAQKEKGGK